MDFMKVIDQTVRQIKREVNLKVLKVPEIEQKVLDATDNEPWGPHGTALAEIAQATKKYFECQLVMNVIWTRLAETGKDWRYVYKALAVIEYLIANGSERALDDIIEHTYQISSLSAFEFVEPNGKDMGINVRKKTETIVALLNNGDKIQEVRNKAAATREKYVGLSSRELSYKSGSPSFSGSKYEGFSGRYDSEVYKYKNDERFQEGNFEKYVPKSQREASSERNNAHPSSRDGGASSKRSLEYDVNTQSNETAIVLANTHIDDDDDFDPRGTTSSKPACSPEVDLFGESLIGELGDTHTSSPPQSTVHNKSSEADFFSEADILSAVPQLEAGPGGYSQTQPNIDLFATESATDTLLSSTMDFFAPSAILPETKSESRVPSTLNSMDPFASITSSNFDESDLFGPLISQPGQSSLNPTGNSLNNSITNDLNGMSLSEYDAPLKEDTFQVRHNNAGYHNAVNYSSSKSLQVYKEPPKNDNFQVKSGIWADSLSRGLIDLNITSTKKVNLAEIGIIGLSDNSEQKPKASQTSSYYMGAST